MIEYRKISATVDYICDYRLQTIYVTIDCSGERL